MIGPKLSSRFDRALVVEDDPVLRRALARSFRGWGLQTLEADSVRSAQLMLRLEPDLVLTDVCLPDGTGQDVATKAARLHSHPFIVAMSGKASPAEVFELARAPVRLYVEKPFTIAELVERIDAAVAVSNGDAIPEHLQSELLHQVRRLAIERALTPREAECVRLTLAGTPRAALAQALGVSPNTCKTLIRGVLRKCGTKRLAQVTTMILTRARSN
jgi:DNA-binding NarL/FixJ family response regulator